MWNNPYRPVFGLSEACIQHLWLTNHFDRKWLVLFLEQSSLVEMLDNPKTMRCPFELKDLASVAASSMHYELIHDCYVYDTKLLPDYK